MGYKVRGLTRRISDLASEVNLITQHDVIFHNYGHTKEIDLRIYLGGWEEGKNVDIDKSVYYDIDHYHSEDEREAALQELVETLEYYKEH